MNDDRKQELTQLLEEAMEGLQIGVRLGGSSLLLPSTTDGASNTTQVFFGRGSLPLPRVKLQDYLQKRWTSYGLDSSSVLMHLEFYFPEDKTKSQLLEFIREELVPFIHKDEIQSFSYAVDNWLDGEFRLFSLRSSLLSPSVLLEHLLKIAIAWGVKKATSTFDDGTCLEGTQGFFQDIASLEGIVVEKEIQVYEGVRLVPFPSQTTFEFERYFPDLSIRRYDLERNMGKTLLITDRPMLSIFHNPSKETFEEIPVNDLPFQIDTDNIKFPNSEEVDSFRKFFCQALSLACNSSVQIARKWWFSAEDEIFRPFSGGGMGYSPQLFGGSVKAGQSEIEEAKRLYKILTNLNTLTNLDLESQEILQIAIERWIKSHTYQKPVDKMIDLAIALEAIYLSDIKETTELAFRLRLRASWYLGGNKAHRKDLMKNFNKIYEWRSKAVHKGKIPNKTKKIPFTEKEVIEFVKEAQKLCSDSIMKILEDGKLPDWNDMILGE